jgi:hypothetical protein
MADDYKNLLGGKTVKPVTKEDMNPPKVQAPKRPGIEPLFPIIPPEKLKQYAEVGPPKPEEALGNGQQGKFDTELNEIALKEMAAERGITVDELLKNPTRKLEQKVEPAMDTPKEATVDLANMRTLLDAQMAATPQSSLDMDLEMEELELERKRLELKRRRLTEQAVSAPTPDPVVSKKPVRNPILDKMREKLSLDRLKPAEVELEGIKFELLPPPSSLHPWILGQISLAEQAGEAAMIFKLKVCTACASLIKVEGQPIAEILGLVELGSIKDPYFPAPDVRLLTSQTLLEMMEGNPSIDSIELFRFIPDTAIKLYEAFTKTFKDLSIRSSLDQDLFIYSCPVPECMEEQQEIKNDLKIFCRNHGVPLEMKGKKMEVMSIPLH